MVQGVRGRGGLGHRARGGQGACMRARMQSGEPVAHLHKLAVHIWIGLAGLKVFHKSTVGVCKLQSLYTGRWGLCSGAWTSSINQLHAAPTC